MKIKQTALSKPLEITTAVVCSCVVAEQRQELVNKASPLS